MLPPVEYHAFVSRLVKTPDGIAMYRLTCSSQGVFYFISRHPVSCFGHTMRDLELLIKELGEAMKLPVLDGKDIK